MNLEELKSRIGDSDPLDVLSVLDESSIKSFYRELLGSEVFIVDIDSNKSIVDDSENLVGLQITGKTSAFGFENTDIEILFEEQYDELKATITINLLENKLAFPNFSTFAIEDVEMGIEASDALVPIKGSISGTVELLTDIRFILEYPVSLNQWLFKGSFQTPKGLEDLIEFTGGASLIESLPSFFKDALDFKVQEVGILYNVEESKLTHTTLKAINDARIEIVPSLFLFNITLDGAVSYEGSQSGSPPVSYSVSAQLQIGDDNKFPQNGYFVAKAGGTDFWFFGGLSDDATISVTDLIEYFFNTADNFPDIEISKFGFSADTNMASYSLLAEIETDWKIYLTDAGDSAYVSLNQAEFSIKKSGGAITGYVSAQFNIAGVDILIAASNSGSDTGWALSGKTVGDQEIPIGAIIEDLVELFGDITLPSAIAELIVVNLGMSFNTKTKNFTFTCEAKFPIDDKQLDITIAIDLMNEGTSYTKTFGGQVIIGELKFNLHFIQNATSDFFVATYLHTGDRRSTNVKELIAEVSSTVSAYIPEVLAVELKDVIFAYSKTVTGTLPETKFLFGFDLGTGINLSNLPLVGHEFPVDATIGVDDLQVMIASKLFNQSLAGQLNGLLPEGVTKLPARDLNSGLSVSAMMQFGSSPEPLDLAVAGQSTATGQTTGSTTGTSTTGNTSTPQTSDNVKWFTLQKTFGPVSFQRVGVQYKDGAIAFLLDAGMTVAGLTLSLNGLSVGSALDKFDPKFDLLGLGVGYKGGSAVDISGSFLRKEVESNGKKYDEYDGAVIIKAEELTISALGSYAELDGHPSMFVYGLLDYPIGGPAFFFVTGLAAGFGYNRKIVTPALDQIVKFPLVEEALSNQRTPNSLLDEMNRLQTYIPPSIGDYFLVFGIKFTSFKIIDSFALLMVLFGNRLEVDILGLSTLIVPTPVPGNTVTPLAKVQMELKATYHPDEGFLAVNAQLTTDSFIISRNCHLAGGFAFYTWFKGEHAGDFVQTLGGYHPSFKAPSHYPIVPRLSFNWRVNNNLTLKGDAYYALTPSMLMAGGSLQATWKDGNIKAWFTAKADFLISWKPYHYDAKIHVNVGVSYKFSVEVLGATVHKTITADAGADVHIWGPEFSGKAHVDISVISFDISFGSGASKKKEPIKDWETFRDSFLPGNDSTCSISVSDGLVSAPNDGKTDWIINPKHFSLVTNSAIPAKAAYKSSERTPIEGTFQSNFGIAPMDLKSNVLSSDFVIEITKYDETTEQYDPVEVKFEFIPILKDVPAGLWGQTMTPDLKGQTFIKEALCGFEIRPAGEPIADVTKTIERSKLQYSKETIESAYDWAIYDTFQATTQNDSQRKEAINETIISPDSSETRTRLMEAFGVSADISLSGKTADAFLIAPIVEA